MDAEFKNQSEKIQDLTDALMSQAVRITIAAKRELSEREKRYLEYFWSPKTQTLRTSLPENIICFFESELFDESLASIIRTRVQLVLMELEMKGYVEPIRGSKPAEYKLTGLGVGFLKDAHPKLMILWDRFWERKPKLLGLGAAAIGLVASVFGIIQFFYDLF